MSRERRIVSVVLLALVLVFIAFRLTLHFMLQAKLNEIRRQA